VAGDPKAPESSFEQFGGTATPGDRPILLIIAGEMIRAAAVLNRSSARKVTPQQNDCPGGRVGVVRRSSGRERVHVRPAARRRTAPHQGDS